MYDDTIELLQKCEHALLRSLPIDWQYMPKATGPVTRGRPRNVVPMAKSRDQWRVGKKHWFYAEVTIPAAHAGVAIRDATAMFHIRGWQPFTMWVNGVELFKEEHAWMATGPIADPYTTAVSPGQVLRMNVCIEPTGLPNNQISLSVALNFAACASTAMNLSIAQMQLRMALELGKTARERTLVSRAVDAIDHDALRARNWDKALESLGVMEDILRPLSPRAKALNVYLLGHTHIDMDWMWTWKDTVHCVRRDMKSASQVLSDYPEVTFIHSQVPTYDTARRRDPAVFKRIQELVQEGRWVNAAGTWVEGDLNMADGESIARHMLQAKQWTAEALGTTAKVFWAPDTFGHPGNMPQLVRLGEFDSYYHMRCGPGEDTPWPVREWIGIDGTPVTAVSSGYCCDLTPAHIVLTAIHNLRHGLRHSLAVWGLGDHGGGLPRGRLDSLREYRDRPLMPTIRFSTMADYLAIVKQDGVKLPKNTGETFSLFEGCFTTHASIKRYNRYCEGSLLTAEALCALSGVDRRKELKDAWTAALFNQFHDILCGASVHNAYRNAHRRAKKTLRIAETVQGEAISAISRPSPNGRDLVVLNPLGFERTEPVRTRLPAGTSCLVDDHGTPAPVQEYDGEHVFIAAAVPSFGARCYRVMKRLPRGTQWPTLPVNEDDRFFHVDSATARLSVSKLSGVIASYYDKRLQREFVAYGVPKPASHVFVTRSDLALNVFQIIDESPNPMSAWHIHDILKEESLLNNARVRLVDSGPVFARFRITHSFRQSQIVEELICYMDYARTDLDLRVRWREKGDKSNGVPQLKVAFAVALRRPRVFSEGPFSVVERPCDGVEYPTQKWVGLTGEDMGFRILNDSKYGYDALGGRLRVTLVRNAYSPDPESDNGTHHVRLAFEPCKPSESPGRGVRSGMAFNRRLVAAMAKPTDDMATSYLAVEGAPSVVCSCLKQAENSRGILVRLYETCGKRCRARIRFRSRIRSVTEVNFLENPIGSGKIRPQSRELTTSFRPYQVKTLLVAPHQ